MKIKKIKLKDISLRIGKKKILEDISFDIVNKTVLIGPNGSGKTMTLSILSQLIKPDKGSVTINNNSENIIYNEKFKEKIGVMIQEGNLNPDKKVIQQMELIQKLRNDKSDIKKTLKKYDIDDILIKHLPHGKYKILLVIQAMMGKPELLILDEPFSGLDIINRKIIEKILKNFKGKILITSHMLNEIKNICDNAVFIKNGKIIKHEKINKIKDLDKYYIKLYS
jgi:ABC-type multidrug transport system ATPase subunit